MISKRFMASYVQARDASDLFSNVVPDLGQSREHAVAHLREDDWDLLRGIVGGMDRASPLVKIRSTFFSTSSTALPGRACELPSVKRMSNRYPDHLRGQVS